MLVKRLKLLVMFTLLIFSVPLKSVAADHKVIFDTDFVIPPQDDGLALILALHSPELEILGITTVAGNDSRERATSDALRVLEIANREEIPVFSGANMPLVHEKSDYATTVHGKWWSDDPPPPPPGGFAKKQAEATSAVDFIVKSVIFDTDFVIPPQDDGLALILALHPPELEIIGITTVAGNDSRERATSDALRVLEIANREEIPVFSGANMPLVHEKSDYATTVHGKWWSDDPPPPPPGGFAEKQAEATSAVDFIVKSVRSIPTTSTESVSSRRTR